jgi:hypothetical protein
VSQCRFWRVWTGFRFQMPCEVSEGVDPCQDGTTSIRAFDSIIDTTQRRSWTSRALRIRANRSIVSVTVDNVCAGSCRTERGPWKSQLESLRIRKPALDFTAGSKKMYLRHCPHPLGRVSILICPWLPEVSSTHSIRYLSGPTKLTNRYFASRMAGIEFLPELQELFQHG